MSDTMRLESAILGHSITLVVGKDEVVVTHINRFLDMKGPQLEI